MARLSGLSKFTIVLDEAGIVYRTEQQQGEVIVIVEATKGPNNGGVEGLSTVFTFDGRSGALVAISAWGPVSADGFAAVV